MRLHEGADAINQIEIRLAATAQITHEIWIADRVLAKKRRAHASAGEEIFDLSQELF